MKTIKILLILAAFLIMVGSVVNLYNTANTDASRLGIYLDLCAMAFIAASVGIISFREKNTKK